LQGQQGIQGTQGITGQQGLTGQGIQGTQGIQGRQGIQGPQGIQGITGGQGTQGLTGQGIQGTQGISGGGGSVTDNTTWNANQYPVWVQGVSGTQSIYVSSTKLYFNPSTGTLNATIFNSLSDESAKINIRTITDSIDLINQINGVRFDWADTGKPSAGLLANEIEKIMPELIDNNNGQKSVNYNGIIGLLVEAVKELAKKV
jgi:hypothetical protein